MKVVSIFLGLINSLLAGLVVTLFLTKLISHTFWDWGALVRFLLALATIGIGVLSWLAMVITIQPGSLVLGSLFLVATGPVLEVWAIHCVSLTGQLVFSMLMYGARPFVQGVTLLLGLAEGPENISIA
jgi:hypothetical protein